MSRILRRISLVLVGLLLLAATGPIYNAIGEARDARRFQPAGQLVDIAENGKLRLHLNCQGSSSGPGRPTVILESGAGVPALSWVLVQSEVAKFARVCSYDRAGYAYSDADVAPRTMARIAEQLELLLRRAGIPGPYVLVGHSIGGIVVRTLYQRIPQQVAGMVLVDSASEFQTERMPIFQKKSAEVQLRELAQIINREKWLQRLGWTRLTQGPPAFPPTWKLTDRHTLEELRYLGDSEKAAEALLSEMRDVFSLRLFPAEGAFGNLPLIVLTHGRPVPEPELSEEENRATERIWQELQAMQVRLSRRGEQRVIADSGHMIPLDRPDTVVAAICDVVNQAQSPQ